MCTFTLTGVLELDVTQNSSGENIYTVELFNQSGKSLYKQLESYLNENVSITIEVLPKVKQLVDTAT